MSFDKFLLAVESRDLSQADKSIIRKSSFPKAVFEWYNLQLYQKKLFGTWQFGKIDILVYTVNIYRYKAIGANATSSVIMYTGKCISPCLEIL